MSARPLSMAGHRPSAVTLTNSTLFGSLKSAVAMSREMSMSNPTSWPFSSVKANGGAVVNVTTMSLPRSSTTSMRDFSCADAGRLAASSSATTTAGRTWRTDHMLMSTSFGLHSGQSADAGLVRQGRRRPPSFTRSRLPEQKRTDRCRVPQHLTEPREGGVHRGRELPWPAEALERLGRDELEEDVRAAGRHADEVHSQHVVVLQQEHAERGRGLEGHDGRLLHAAALHGDGEHVVGEQLRRGGRLVQAVAEDRPQLRGHGLGRVDQLLHSLGAVLLKRPHHGLVEHRPSLQAALERSGADGRHEIRTAGQETEPRAEGTVLVETRGAHVDAELERLRLIEACRSDACATGIIHVDKGALVVR